MFKPFVQPISGRLASLGLRAALLCMPAVCIAQPAPPDTPVPASAPTVMTTRVMQVEIERLVKDLTAMGAYVVIGSDSRLGCACGGGPTLPNFGGPGPRSRVDIQNMARALEAIQLMLNNERAGLSTTIYSTQQQSKAGGAAALPN
jgi:hypothetical protein